MFKQGTGWNRRKLPMRKIKFTFFWPSLKLFHITPHFHLKQFPDSTEHRILKYLLIKRCKCKWKRICVLYMKQGKLWRTHKKQKREIIILAFANYIISVMQGNHPSCVLSRTCTLSWAATKAHVTLPKWKIFVFYEASKEERIFFKHYKRDGN